MLYFYLHNIVFSYPIVTILYVTWPWCKFNVFATHFQYNELAVVPFVLYNPAGFQDFEYSNVPAPSSMAKKAQVQTAVFDSPSQIIKLDSLTGALGHISLMGSTLSCSTSVIFGYRYTVDKFSASKYLVQFNR